MSRTLFILAVSVVCACAQLSGDVATLKLRAEKGDVAAQNSLAEAYLSRFYYSDAVKWFRAAAESGSTNAQWRLGQILIGGKPAFPQRSQGVKADPAQGISWLKRAAFNGHASAQNDLARCYEKGSGVRKDPIEAFKWHTIAARRGSIVSATARNQIALKLTPVEITEGERRAAAFVVGQQPAIWESVTLKGISGPASRPLALVNNKTVSVGEQFTLSVDGGSMQLRCQEIRTSSVILAHGKVMKELFLSSSR